MKKDKLSRATQSMYTSYNSIFDNWKSNGDHPMTGDILQEFIDEHFMGPDALTGKARSDAAGK